MSGGGGGQQYYFATLSPPDLEFAQDLIRSRLTDLGYQQPHHGPKSKNNRNNKNNNPLPKTPGKAVSSAARIFGRPLRDLRQMCVPMMPQDPEEEMMMVPEFLVALCDHLRPHLDTEGIFRKSGSAARQKSLRKSLEQQQQQQEDQGGCWEEHLSGAAILDVAAVLKQWLRELPEPLLPTQVQKMLLE